MDEDTIPNPMPAWMDDRFGPMNARPGTASADPARRRPGRGVRPVERHFPDFESAAPAPDEGDPYPAYEQEPAAPAPAPEPALPVEEIVRRAVEQALTAMREGRLTVEALQAERQRVNGLRAGIDESLRMLREDKPPYWRERRFWMLKVREMTHNRMHILNRQILVLTRASLPPAAEPAPPAEPGEAVSS